MNSPDNALTHWFSAPQLKSVVWEPWGAGHIHHTFKVTDGRSTWILQQINEQVFRDIPGLMSQTRIVLDQWGNAQSDYVVPDLVATESGHWFAHTSSGWWRMWRFIEGSTVVDPPTNPDQVKRVARAFGRFHRAMAPLKDSLKTAIEGFGELNRVLAHYDEISASAAGSTEGPDNDKLAGWCRYVESNRQLARLFVVPTGVIHGDCKINNVLFDASGSDLLALIDFDTVMPGHWAWDFGDLVRSVCFSLGGYRAAYYRACVQGFVDGTALDSGEQDEYTLALVQAPVYVSFMLGVRFLTDHLEGDVYFRADLPGQNLVRAEQQFKLCQAFHAADPQMREIAGDVIGV